MINSINPSADNFLVNIDRIQARAERAQRQLSSGLRVTKPSEDPDQVGNILQLSSSLARNEQIGHNLDQVKSEVDAGEQALSRAVATLEQANVLAAQGANFTTSTAARAGMAEQVKNLLDRLIANANTNTGGRYIFAGDSDQVPPYGLDLTSATGTTPYGGSAATRQVEHPRGGTFPVSQTAQQIFEGPGAAASAFAAVNSLRLALLAGDPAAVTASIAALRTAHDHLSESLSFYGSIQVQVNDAISDVKTTASRLTTNLSSLRDADLVGASVELTAAKLSLDAAFSARAKVPPTSLFDFLR